MKRLTVKTGVYQDDGHREVAGMKCGVELKDIFDRLAAIEDILGDEYDLDELKEVVQAKREGRCVVLPCKVEDDVYINILGRMSPSRKNGHKNTGKNRMNL